MARYVHFEEKKRQFIQRTTAKQRESQCSSSLFDMLPYEHIRELIQDNKYILKSLLVYGSAAAIGLAGIGTALKTAKTVDFKKTIEDKLSQTVLSISNIDANDFTDYDFGNFANRDSVFYDAKIEERKNPALSQLYKKAKPQFVESDVSYLKISKKKAKKAHAYFTDQGFRTFFDESTNSLFVRTNNIEVSQWYMKNTPFGAEMTLKKERVAKISKKNLEDFVTALCRQMKVDSNLAHAITKNESNYNTAAVAHKLAFKQDPKTKKQTPYKIMNDNGTPAQLTAYGHMQINPKNHYFMKWPDGSKIYDDDLFDPIINTYVGLKIMKSNQEYTKKINSADPIADAARLYNAGPKNLNSARAKKIPETQNYVAKVKRDYYKRKI